MPPLLLLRSYIEETLKPCYFLKRKQKDNKCEKLGKEQRSVCSVRWCQNYKKRTV